MSDIEILSPSPPGDKAGQARSALLRRLVDVVAMPTSAIAPSDRSMAGDVLLDMMFHVDDGDRLYVSHRLQEIREAPRRLLRYLGQCAFEIAEPVLRHNLGLDACDLSAISRETSPQHAIAIAQRKTVEPALADALSENSEPEVVRMLLRNKGADLPESCVDRIVTLSRHLPEMCAPLLARPELKPAQAMALFWWADGPSRRLILSRHAADRAMLIERCSDVFPMAAAENWSDPVTRKTLQLIEPRQRNRLAIEKSPYDSLEHAVEVASKKGLSGQVAQEIGYLAGVKPVTIAKILSDKGGDGLAILCKATGLKREYLRLLWEAQRRPAEVEAGEIHPQFAYVSETYEILSSGKAQTVLRYWNWALSSSYSPKQTFDTDHANDEEDFSTTRRTARLVFGR